MKSRDVPPLQRISTGEPALDQILRGGIPVDSLSVIAGEPGSGKTALVLQLLFDAASKGTSCLYFTTLSESNLKLLRYMQLFSFFDADVANAKVKFVDLASVLAKGRQATLAAITDRVAEEEPGLVVLDSFRALGDVLGDRRGGRAFTYELAVQMAASGATTLLVGEYTPEEVRTFPEFGVADAVIVLGGQRQELALVRDLEVLKMRGTDYVTGRHFFDITGDGLRCYPRVRAPDLDDVEEPTSTDRCSTGLRALDAMLGGGLPRRSATLVQGLAGTGKTLIALHFLVDGARRGEKGILFAFEETPAQLRRIAEGYGWDLRALERAGQLELVYASPVELSTDRFLEQARRQMARLGAQRVAFDSVSTMELGVSSHRRFRELTYALTRHARAVGASLMMTLESSEAVAADGLSATSNLSFASDNIIQLGFQGDGKKRERSIAIVKARGTAHEMVGRRFVIGSKGVEISPAAGAP